MYYKNTNFKITYIIFSGKIKCIIKYLQPFLLNVYIIILKNLF